jgi:hypothetical protein
MKNHSTKSPATCSILAALVGDVAKACYALDKAVLDAASGGVSDKHLSDYLMLFSDSIRTTSSTVLASRWESCAEEAGWVGPEVLAEVGAACDPFLSK